ncbi:MAG: ABC transporter ATP-binding protein [Bacillota bacterium]|nr:ABC transporter ATP-binding protein [Bacillota bacterium]
MEKNLKMKPSGIFKSEYLRKYFSKYKNKYIIGILVLIIIDILQLRIPLIIGRAVDFLKSQGAEVAGLSRYIFLVIVIGLGVAVGRFVWRHMIFGTSRFIEYDIRNELFGHLEKLSLKYYNKHKTGDIMAHMTNDLNAVRMAVGPGVLMVVDAAVIGTLTIYNMITEIDLKLTLLAGIPLLLIIVNSIIIGKIMRVRFKEKQAAFSDLSDFTQERISGIYVIKSFVQESREIEAFKKVTKDYYDKNLKMLKIFVLMRPFMRFISGFSLAVVIGYGGYLSILGTITVGEFVAFVQFIGMLVWPMVAIGFTFNILSMGGASLERIETILDEEIDIKDTEYVDNSITEIKGDIKVENLNFKYHGEKESALKNISFNINRGETLGIIGRTGSGKTSLVNLLLRLHDPEKNTIFIDGKDILEIPLNTLRDSIGYVPQDNFLFTDNIYNNIDFGHRDKSKDEIIEAAKKACVHDNIIEFKDGYETLVGERGVTLSGGQKQRISIARALIKDPRILILDDAVSSVDTDTEEKILGHLKEGRKDKTTIIIAHRISTIQNADRIIVIDEGEVIEKGTHSELLENEKLYHSLYQKQLLEKELEEDDNGDVIE